MAHWAEIDENNIVLRVVVGSNDEPDEGYQWIIDNLGGRWLKTSYNGNIRKNFAGVGYAYDEKLDAFIPPKPVDFIAGERTWEHIFDEENCVWLPRVKQK
jgi:hypothetical protein